MSPRKKNESDKQRNMGRIAFWCSLYSASFKEQYVNRLDAATDMTCISYWCRHFDFPVRHCAVNTGCTLPVLVKLLGLIKVHCCTQVLLESCYKQWILWPFQTQCISQCTCWCTPAVHSAVRFAWRSKRKKKKSCGVVQAIENDGVLRSPCCVWKSFYFCVIVTFLREQISDK